MNVDLIENPRHQVVILGVFLVVMSIVMIHSTHQNSMEMKENCNSLIDSERVIMESDPTFDWRTDSYFIAMWFDDDYNCNNFYDLEKTMNVWTTGERLSVKINE